MSDKSLYEYIEELGQEAKEVYQSMFNKNILLPVKDTKTATQVLEHISSQAAKRFEHIAKNIQHLKKKYNTEDNVKLAARFVDHDLINVINVFLHGTIPLEKALKTEPIQSYEDLQQGKKYLFPLIIQASQSCRQLSLATAMIATQSKEYSEKIALKNLNHILDSTSIQKPCKVSDLYQSIPTGVFTAAYIMAKNAKYLGFDKVNLNAETTPEYNILNVTDQGTGIKGIPLENLPVIFADYSSTGGGLGLQIAKECMELEGGYIDVLTSREDENLLYFSSRQAITPQEIAPFAKTGTTFSLYFPKEA